MSYLKSSGLCIDKFYMILCEKGTERNRQHTDTHTDIQADI